MAKTEATALDPEKVLESMQADSEKKPEQPKPVPFVEPQSIRPGATAQQRAWLSNHPQYAPMAHGMINFSDRGTLHADGTFVSEVNHPPMDGGGAISVGIPISRR